MEWASEVDTSRPNPARMYDYMLGGAHNLAVDREQAERVIAAQPRTPFFARANRSFLRRAVRFMLDSGIDQFLDLGSGIPTVGNVHEIAQRSVPGARVVYVDIDPVAVEHARQILADNPAAVAIQGDLRAPAAVLSDPALVDLLDLRRPVGLLLVSVLHFVPDSDDPRGIIATYRRALAPGSCLAISHGCLPDAPTPGASEARDAYQATSMPLTLRGAEEVETLFDGWTLAPPGVVEATRWRPDEPVDESGPVPGVAAVGCLATGPRPATGP